jgi:hypothetical protein
MQPAHGFSSQDRILVESEFVIVNMLQIAVIILLLLLLDNILKYKRSWIQHVDRMQEMNFPNY